MAHPTSSQLRGDIDSGRAEDKAPANDPAAAPLGTDAEAGGSPASGPEIQQARQNETRKPSGDAGPNQSSATPTPSGGKGAGPAAPWMIIVGIAALVLVIVAVMIVAGG